MTGQPRKPLQRKTPLKSGGSLARKPFPRQQPCVGKTREPKPKTDADRAEAAAERHARRLVKARSGGWCEICGQKATNFQHRMNKGQGGPWSASNGIDVCGWGNYSGCHGNIHQNPTYAKSKGWTVLPWRVPAEVPVYLPARGGWVLLDDEGGYAPVLDVEGVA